MTQEIINDLNNQIKHKAVENKGLAAQLESSKQMLNESLNSGLMIRAQAILIDGALKEAHQENASLKQRISELEKKIIEINETANTAAPAWPEICAAPGEEPLAQGSAQLTNAA